MNQPQKSTESIKRKERGAFIKDIALRCDPVKQDSPFTVITGRGIWRRSRNTSSTTRTSRFSFVHFVPLCGLEIYEKTQRRRRRVRFYGPRALERLSQGQQLLRPRVSANPQSDLCPQRGQREGVRGQMGLRIRRDR